MFLLKTLHCSYVNFNEFHKHDRLFMIMVQQVPKSWNIGLNLFVYWISRFSQFFTIFTKFRTSIKFQNHIITKLNAAKFEILFFIIFDQSIKDIDTRILHISAYNNEIRVSATYLITITLINIWKIDIQWGFRFLF